MVLFLLFWGGTAHADMVRPMKDACPDGSMGQQSHGGGYCNPVYQAGQCASDADCTDGTQCVELSRCLVTRTRIRRGPTPEGNSYTLVEMVFPTEDGACNEGECTTMKVCASASAVGTDACVPAGASSPAAPAGQEPEAAGAATAPAEPATEKTEEGGDDSSSCATGVAGLSASMAGLLGLVALGRRER
jgi:hypothetical protein